MCVCVCVCVSVGKWPPSASSGGGTSCPKASSEGVVRCELLAAALSERDPRVWSKTPATAAKSALLNPECASESCGALVKHRLLYLRPTVSDSVSPGWGLRIHVAQVMLLLLVKGPCSGDHCDSSRFKKAIAYLWKARLWVPSLGAFAHQHIYKGSVKWGLAHQKCRWIFFLFWKILSRYSWFTISCKFQLYSTAIQLHICTYIPFQILFPYRLLQYIEYSSLCRQTDFITPLILLKIAFSHPSPIPAPMREFQQIIEGRCHCT